MKKTIFCLVAAMAVLACSKTEENEVTVDSQKPVYTLYGNIVQETGTKVYINDNGGTPHTFSHYWVAGDKISVFGDSNTPEGGYEFTVPNKEGGYDYVGEFNGVIDDKNEWGETSIYAIYPYNESNEVAVDNGPTFTVTYPAAQTLTENSYDPNANVYVATGTGDNLTFYNTTAYLRLALYTSLYKETEDKVYVSKIELSTLDDTEIAGTGIVTLVPQEQPTSVGSVTVTGSNIITLTPASEISISKTSSEPTYFYVAVPAVDYAKNFAGYQVKIYSEETIDEKKVETYQFRNLSTGSNAQPLSPNTVRLMSPLEYNPVSSGSTATLVTGEALNVALKELAGTTLNDTDPFKTNDQTIEHIIIETNKNMTGYTGGTNQVAVNANPDNANEIPIIASWNATSKTIRIQTAASKIKTQSCASMFRSFIALIDISGLDGFLIGSGKSMSYMFMNSNQLKGVDMTNLSFEASNVASACTQMFQGCSAVESVSFPKTAFFASGLASLFNQCSELKEVINLNKIRSSSSLKSVARMFSGCAKLTNVSFHSSFTCSAVTDMSEMFSGCSELTGPLSLSNFNTAAVQNASKMFYRCSSLTGITFGSNVTFAACTNYSSMFEGCEEIKSLDISNLRNNQDGKLRDVSKVFKDCKKLEYVTFSGSGTNEEQAFRYVQDASEMFMNCEALESIDISKMLNITTNNTKNVSFSEMFSGCKSLSSLTMRNATHSRVTDTSYMFYGCTTMENFEFGDKVTFANCTDMSYMFSGCTSLGTLSLGSGFIGANGVTLDNFISNPLTTSLTLTCSSDFQNRLAGANINSENIANLSIINP